jgi:hypothetical protein
MISNVLFTYVIDFLVVKPKLTRILMNMDLGPLYVDDVNIVGVFY